MTLYKVLNAKNQSTHGGSLSWSVPTRNEDGTWNPGDWHEAVGKVEACDNGLHLTEQPMHWPVCGMRVYEAEGDGDSDTDYDDPRHKIAFQRARLIRPADDLIPAYWRNVEAFVAELPTIPWMQPDGNPDPEWRLFPTRDAAGDAAWDAARDAAGDAAWDAAWDAAGDAAWDAAGNAAWGAAGNAAWGAAGDAAWGAAGDAAGDAAWDAAGDAAWDAARAAALWARVLVCDGLPLAQKHVDHAAARMDVWRKGYGLYGDVDGVLYAYKRVTA